MALTITTSPATVQLAKNPVFVKFLSTSYSLLDNYRVVLRVLYEATYESSTYAQIVEAEAIPDSNGETCFDISSILATAMARTMTNQVPDLTNQIPYIADTLRRFKIQYLEKYGTPQVEQSATTSIAYKVLYGGVDAHYFGLYNFFSNLSATNALLTYHPSGKIISSDQPEYITYIQHAAATYPHAFVRVVEYDSGGNSLGTKDLYRLNADYPDPIYLDRYQAAVFPTGPDAIVMDADTVKYTVQVFTVEAFDTGTGLVESGSPAAASQQYTYYVNNAVQVSPQTLIWFSGFQAPHILRCTGRKATRLDVQRLISEQVVGFNYDSTAMASLQHSRSFNQAYTYRSGSLKPDEKDALQELLIENRLLEYAADGQYYRLMLTGNGFPILETETSPNYLEFTAVRALAPRNYMRLSSNAASAPTEQGWLVSDNGFWELGVSGGYWQL